MILHGSLSLQLIIFSLHFIELISKIRYQHDKVTFLLFNTLYSLFGELNIKFLLSQLLSQNFGVRNLAVLRSVHPLQILHLPIKQLLFLGHYRQLVSHQSSILNSLHLIVLILIDLTPQLRNHVQEIHFLLMEIRDRFLTPIHPLFKCRNLVSISFNIDKFDSSVIQFF